MPEKSEKPEFSTSEITAMRYAYRQLLGNHPERFPSLNDREELARSVVKTLAQLRPGPGRDIAEVVTRIMEGHSD
jgi:hypothetical protein